MDLADKIKSHPSAPLLTHLNADNSWLISFPRPDGPRKYFHLIIDLWLNDIVSAKLWFIISVAHAIMPAFNTVDDIRELIRRIESSASTNGDNASETSDKASNASNTSEVEDTGEPDALIASHYLDDHCSQPVITQLQPDTPIITVHGGVELIKGWKHNKYIECMPDLDDDRIQDLWQKPQKSLLPDYLRIGRLNANERYPALHWCTVIAYTFEGQVCTVMLAPHGFYEDRLVELDWARESKVVLMLHGLDAKDDPIIKANLGVDNGRKIVQKVKPRYWVPTHDEILKFTGVLGWLQRRVEGVWSGEESIVEGRDGTICKVVGNGETIVLK